MKFFLCSLEFDKNGPSLFIGQRWSKVRNASLKCRENLLLQIRQTSIFDPLDSKLSTPWQLRENRYCLIFKHRGRAKDFKCFGVKHIPFLNASLQNFMILSESKRGSCLFCSLHYCSTDSKLLEVILMCHWYFIVLNWI